MKNGKISVLVVERSEKDAKSLSRTLESAPDISVLDYAKNGYEAITKIHRLSPQVVCMNVILENEMTAPSVCREIGSFSPETRVVLFGKPSSSEIVYKAFQMGACNFLVEDYTRQELISAVIDAGSGKPSIHASAAGLLCGKISALMNLTDNLSYLMNVITRLTPAEFNILHLVYNGMCYQEVSTVLFISSSTMKTHISHILKKFNLESMSQVLELLRSTELFSLIQPSENTFE